jgi:hypothetical protein
MNITGTTLSSMATSHEIRLGTAGFAATEQLLIKSACMLLNLTEQKSSKAPYQINLVDSNSPQDIDIYVVDAKQHPPPQNRQWIREQHPRASIIFVGSEVSTSSDPDEYTLERKEFSKGLIKYITILWTIFRQRTP